MDIRKLTCLIVRKNGEYLVGRVMGTKDLRWSIYAHEAWRTRNREKAEEIARRTGGIICLYNPAAGQIKVIGA